MFGPSSGLYKVRVKRQIDNSPDNKELTWQTNTARTPRRWPS
jgi:hypothetical protein